MSRVRKNYQYTNNAGTGSPLFPNGVRVTGVATATTFDGSATQLLHQELPRDLLAFPKFLQLSGEIT